MTSQSANTKAANDIRTVLASTKTRSLTRTISVFSCVLVVALFAGLSYAGDCAPCAPTWSDSDFAPESWTVSEFVVHGNGGTSQVTSHATGGVDGGPFREIEFSINEAPGPDDWSGVYLFHAFKDASHEPATGGAIGRVHYREFFRATQPAYPGAAQLTGPAVEQNGTVFYFHQLAPSNTEWTEFVLCDLTQDDFQDIDGTPPDFSLDGAPLQFGFVRANSTSNRSAGYTNAAAIDAWELTINTVGVTDLDGDGSTGFADLLTLLSSWGACGCCPADIDLDGVVGFTDLLFLLADWS